VGAADGIGVRALRAVDEVQPETCFSWHEVNAKAHDRSLRITRLDLAGSLPVMQNGQVTSKDC